MGLTDIDVVTPFLTDFHVFVPYQGPLAVRAVDQLSENIGGAPQSVIFPLPLMVSSPSLFSHLLNRLKGFFIYQRLMGITNNYPLGFWDTAGLSALGQPGAFPALYHMTQVNFAGQYVFKEPLI